MKRLALNLMEEWSCQVAYQSEEMGRRLGWPAFISETLWRFHDRCALIWLRAVAPDLLDNPLA